MTVAFRRITVLLVVVIVFDMHVAWYMASGARGGGWSTTARHHAAKTLTFCVELALFYVLLQVCVHWAINARPAAPPRWLLPSLFAAERRRAGPPLLEPVRREPPLPHGHAPGRGHGIA